MSGPICIVGFWRPRTRNSSRLPTGMEARKRLNGSSWRAWVRRFATCTPPALTSFR